jgi:hypothetical protein
MSSSATQRRACGKKGLSPELMKFIFRNAELLENFVKQPAADFHQSSDSNIPDEEPALGSSHL